MYLLTNERYITYQRGFSFGPWVMPRSGTWWYHGGLGAKIFFFRNSTRFGLLVTYMNSTCTSTIFWSPAPGALGRGQKFNFLNMVVWHIKLKGMSSRPGYTTYDQIGDLGMGSKCQLPLDFCESVGICDGAPSNVF